MLDVFQHGSVYVRCVSPLLGICWVCFTLVCDELGAFHLCLTCVSFVYPLFDVCRNCLLSLSSLSDLGKMVRVFRVVSDLSLIWKVGVPALFDVCWACFTFV